MLVLVPTEGDVRSLCSPWGGGWGGGALSVGGLRLAIFLVSDGGNFYDIGCQGCRISREASDH